MSKVIQNGYKGISDHSVSKVRNKGHTVPKNSYKGVQSGNDKPYEKSKMRILKRKYCNEGCGIRNPIFLFASLNPLNWGARGDVMRRGMCCH